MKKMSEPPDDREMAMDKMIRSVMKIGCKLMPRDLTNSQTRNVNNSVNMVDASSVAKMDTWLANAWKRKGKGPTKRGHSCKPKLPRKRKTRKRTLHPPIKPQCLISMPPFMP